MKKHPSKKGYDIPDWDMPTHMVSEPVSPFYERGGLAHAVALMGLTEPDSMADVPTDFDLVSLIRSGLSGKVLERMMQYYDLPSTEMARLLHISDRTLRRYEKDSLLDPEQSERLVELARLYAHGIDVFGSGSRFRRWLNSSVFSLGGERPIDLLDTSIGIGLLNDTLGRIEHGIVS